jgi:hypothetical protein
MNRLLIVAILMLSTAPLYAQGQLENIAKLKQGALNAVGIIGADRGKTQSIAKSSASSSGSLGGPMRRRTKRRLSVSAEDRSIAEKTRTRIRRAGEYPCGY